MSFGTISITLTLRVIIAFLEGRLPVTQVVAIPFGKGSVPVPKG